MEQDFSQTPRPPSHASQPTAHGVARKPGAPFGNQNARKCGFYAHTLSPEDQQSMRNAADIEGLDEEIALLRSRISIAAKDPAQSSFLISAISLLTRLLNAKKKLGLDESKNFSKGIAGVLNDLGPDLAASIIRQWRKEGVVFNYAGPILNEAEGPIEGTETNPNNMQSNTQNEPL